MPSTDAGRRKARKENTWWVPAGVEGAAMSVGPDDLQSPFLVQAHGAGSDVHVQRARVQQLLSRLRVQAAPALAVVSQLQRAEKNGRVRRSRSENRPFGTPNAFPVTE